MRKAAARRRRRRRSPGARRERPPAAAPPLPAQGRVEAIQEPPPRCTPTSLPPPSSRSTMRKTTNRRRLPKRRLAPGCLTRKGRKQAWRAVPGRDMESRRGRVGQAARDHRQELDVEDHKERNEEDHQPPPLHRNAVKRTTRSAMRRFTKRVLQCQLTANPLRPCSEKQFIQNSKRMPTDYYPGLAQALRTPASAAPAAPTTPVAPSYSSVMTTGSCARIRMSNTMVTRASTAYTQPSIMAWTRSGFPYSSV